MTVSLRKIGGNVALVIPKGISHEMQLKEGTLLDISTSGGALILRRQGRRPLRQIVDQISPASYRRRNQELSEGKPAGKEVW